MAKKHPSFTTVEERVTYIADRLMRRGRWVKHKTQMELAAAWVLDPATIRGYSAEASRSLRLDPDERDALRAELAAHAARLRRMATRERSKVTGLRNIEAALKAIELHARLVGLDAAQAQSAQAAPKIEIVAPSEADVPPKPDPDAN